MKEICWASKEQEHYKDWLRSEDGGHEFLDHWSRKFEYPWALAKGGFEHGQVTLDAAGGDAPLQRFIAEKTGVVFNVDSDKEALARGKQRWDRQNIIRRVDDLRTIGSGGGFFCEGFFDRVVCVSALEHIPDHMDVLKELWWVLKKGGRMIVTFDVASYSRWNHSIDLARAVKIAAMFGLEVPLPGSKSPDGPSILKAVFPEIQRTIGYHEFIALTPNEASLAPGELVACVHCGEAFTLGGSGICLKRNDPESVELKVLCMVVDKE